MTFYSRRREGAHLISEGNGRISRAQGFADAAVAALFGPGLLVSKGPKGFVPYDGSAKLEGVVYGYADENLRFAFTSRLAEVKGGLLQWRQSAPTVVTGSAAQNVSPAGNLSVNGTVLAIADGATPAAVAAQISGSAAGVSASVVDGKLRLVRASGGSVTVAGDAGVLADLGLVAGVTPGATPAQLRAADTAALSALDIVVR
ncbi:MULTISPECIES: hypothetical protein [unclassified Methylobacterium]|uniref:hypothetical protein n=1 Tax=unclassified Methylobacterium TaxID=2615210 RepID=UPI000CCA58C0|nr:MULTISPECIES: hypothetical protein [unclassified Methylobacterium]PIU06625.1 MAG: hypothetical protein COT56_08830 [Methylobacterium sp. CG09_land_8_20_14_0_10_71_15]PIU12117.1 MAG: hypothetical protein COT28_16950 [Methylobacterium sp. CG08_land_8_20_14_0_20_71_15]GBU19005.1 hypothetical protein AwMethylo_32200 [Methylobacterium sp.]